MSGLLFLRSDDFLVQNGQKGDILTTRIPGVSLILFYSTKCVHCKYIIPIFKQLPGSIPGCQFGIINISNNKTLVIKSRKTILPLQYVPYILLYVNGKPYVQYNGSPDLDSIRNFVINIYNSLQSKHFFATDKKDTKQDDIIPKYSIGKPLFGYDQDVCYLEFKNAY